MSVRAFRRTSIEYKDLLAFEERIKESGMRPENAYWGRQLLNMIDKHTPSMIFQVSDPEIVGFVLAWILEGRTLHIAKLVVHPDHQRKGYGRTLMRSVLDETRDRYPDVTSCTLMVAVDNEPARRLYESLGFSEERIMTGYYGILKDALKCRCNVSGNAEKRLR